MFGGGIKHITYGAGRTIQRDEFLLEGAMLSSGKLHGFTRELLATGVSYYLHRDGATVAYVKFDRNLLEIRRKDTRGLLADITSASIKYRPL